MGGEFVCYFTLLSSSLISPVPLYYRNIAQPEVNKFSGSCHEGFDTRDEALAKFWEAWGQKKVYSESGNIVGIPGLTRMP